MKLIVSSQKNPNYSAKFYKKLIELLFTIIGKKITSIISIKKIINIIKLRYQFISFLVFGIFSKGL